MRTAKHSLCISCCVCILLMSVLFFTPTLCRSESIDFDGYWWGAASEEQRYGYIQGFAQGSGITVIITLNSFLESFKGISSTSREFKRLADKLRKDITAWEPYDHTFGYYYERIDGFYRSTQSMRTPVAKIMLDFINPPPNY